jgi:ATP-dependent HslUV protease subunit HslV
VTIGSGGPFALAAARAFLRANPKLAAEKVARMSLEVAADICIYTNREITVKGLK